MQESFPLYFEPEIDLLPKWTMALIGEINPSKDHSSISGVLLDLLPESHNYRIRKSGIHRPIHVDMQYSKVIFEETMESLG